MNSLFLSLGSNMGNRIQFLKKALEMIEHRIGRIKHSSSVYETEPWGKTDQPDFLNMVVEVHSESDPQTCMAEILKIEQDLGRVRKEKWSERKIDIDILFFNNEVIHTQHLKVPHPHLQERRFVLNPLCEIAPNLIHPVLNCTIKELLTSCNDKTIIKKTDFVASI